MKLSDWAKLQGISYKTAWRWFDQGKLPVPAEQTLTGTILVKTEENNLDCVVYARVSSSDQKTDLDRQIARVAFCKLLHKIEPTHKKITRARN